MVRRKGLILVVVALACRPAPPAPSRTAEPRIRATVVTIQTTLQPQNKTFIHSVVIANGRVVAEERPGDAADLEDRFLRLVGEAELR